MVIIFIAQCAFYTTSKRFLRCLDDSISNKSYFRWTNVSFFTIVKGILNKWKQLGKHWGRYGDGNCSSSEMKDKKNLPLGQLNSIANIHISFFTTWTFWWIWIYLFLLFFFFLFDAFIKSSPFTRFTRLNPLLFCVHKSVKQYYENPISVKSGRSERESDTKNGQTLLTSDKDHAWLFGNILKRAR